MFCRIRLYSTSSSFICELRNRASCIPVLDEGFILGIHGDARKIHNSNSVICGIVQNSFGARNGYSLIGYCWKRLTFCSEFLWGKNVDIGMRLITFLGKSTTVEKLKNIFGQLFTLHILISWNIIFLERWLAASKLWSQEEISFTRRLIIFKQEYIFGIW